MEAKWHHVAISVKSMEQALYFYRDLLGFEVDWDMDHRGGKTMGRVVDLPDPDAHMVMLKGYGARIELFKYHSPVGAARKAVRQCDLGLMHFALQVRNVHELYNRLIEDGVAFNCPPENLRPGVWATYMRDPEGNTIELVEYEDRGTHAEM
jgi:catechol 2,3-dioxygenase-like lactoylglutathione lyase family enzyme